MVRFPNGTRIHFPPCKISPPFPDSGWNEWADWCYCPATPPSIGSFDAFWTVPIAPSTNHNQILYFWNGLEPSRGSPPVIQPVLQWGYNGIIGGQFWLIASWWVTTGDVSINSAPVNVRVGDSIEGKMTSTNCQPNGNCDWVVQSRDATISQATQLNCTTNPKVCGLAFWWSGAVFETIGVQACSDLPGTGAVDFTSMQLTNQAGTAITATWAAMYNFHDCNQQVVLFSPQHVSLQWTP